MFVTGIESKIHKFLRVVEHILSFCLSGLDEIKANIQDQIGQKPKEYLFIVIILCRETQIFKSFNNKIRNAFFIQKLFQICPLTKDDKRLDQEWNKTYQSIECLMLFLLDAYHNLFIFVLLLEQKVNTFQTFGFELVDLVVEDLETCDVDDAVVVW